MTAVHFGIFSLITENTTRTMAGTILMGMMITGAGTVEKREKHRIRKYKSFVSE